MKCVVATLVEGDELQDENEAGGLIQTSNDDSMEDFTDPKWDPEPVDAAPRNLWYLPKDDSLRFSLPIRQIWRYRQYFGQYL